MCFDREHVSPTAPWVGLERYDLRMSDRYQIENNELEDRVVDAAQGILRRQYGNGLHKCLQSVVTSQVGMKPSRGPCVQIHYDADRHHWVTSCLMNGRIQLADSKQTAQLSMNIKKQLRQKYPGHDTVHVLSVVQQTNSVDCGVFSIAFAVGFLDGDPLCQFDETGIRQHLINCMEAKQFSVFPCSRSPRSGCKRGKDYEETL